MQSGEPHGTEDTGRFGTYASFVARLRQKADKFEHYADLGIFHALDLRHMAVQLRIHADKLEAPPENEP